jgi:large subunit ribosomal protein L15
MNLHSLKPAEGSTKKGKRIGRGQGSGKGGTSTKGHKGAQSRSGYSRKMGFEGGQMPIQRRIPKRGFKNPFRVEYVGVNLDFLEKLATDNKLTSISKETLIQHNIIDKKDNVKILGRGELKTKIDVTADGFSKTAKEAIEKLGGKTEIINKHDNNKDA